MANVSVSHTFSNSTTADATQVNTNFTDIINGTSDGTKDFSISALTCAGNVTFNGNTTIGNASSDDFTLTASLASSIPIKTTATYAIGSSTKGLTGVYFGNSTFTTLLQCGTLSASNTLTLPTRTGTVALAIDAPTEAINYSLTASVAASALTVALKTKAASDASSSDPIFISFRSATAATGTYVQRSVTGALSVVVSSGSTLGHASAKDEYVYIYAIDNAGTVELAVSSSKIWDEGTRQTTTAEGGAGAADSKVLLYSSSARTDVGVRLLGRIKSQQATAGTWATAISEISLAPFMTAAPKSEVCVSTGNGYGSTNTKIRRFSVTVKSVGTGITYADSATDGSSFTITEDGVYSMSFTDVHSSAFAVGISLNSTEMTTAVPSITDAHILAVNDAPAAGRAHCAATSSLKVGDIVRPHAETVSANTSTSVRFRICQVSKG